MFISKITLQDRSPWSFSAIIFQGHSWWSFSSISNNILNILPICELPNGTHQIRWCARSFEMFQECFIKGCFTRNASPGMLHKRMLHREFFKMPEYSIRQNQSENFRSDQNDERSNFCDHLNVLNVTQCNLWQFGSWSEHAKMHLERQLIKCRLLRSEQKTLQAFLACRSIRSLSLKILKGSFYYPKKWLT